MWKGSTGRYVQIAVDHTTNLLRRVFPTYRLYHRLPTYAKQSMTNEVRYLSASTPSVLFKTMMIRTSPSRAELWWHCMTTSPRPLFFAIYVFFYTEQCRKKVYYMVVPIDWNILSYQPCTATSHEALTRCLPHLKNVLHTTSNIKSSRIIYNTPGRWCKGCLLSTTVISVSFKGLLIPRTYWSAPTPPPPRPSFWLNAPPKI